MSFLLPTEIVIADRSFVSQGECSEIDDSMHLESLLGSSYLSLGSLNEHDNAIHLPVRWGIHEEKFIPGESINENDSSLQLPRRQKTDECVHTIHNNATGETSPATCSQASTRRVVASSADKTLRIPRRQPTKEMPTAVGLPVLPRRQQTKESTGVQSAPDEEAGTVGRLLQGNPAVRRVRTSDAGKSTPPERVPRLKRRGRTPVGSADSSATLQVGNHPDLGLVAEDQDATVGSTA